MFFESVADAWKSLYDGLELSSAHPIQQREMRNAFYLGYQSCFDTVLRISKDYTKDEAADFLDDLNEELDIFQEEKEKEFNVVQKRKGR